MPKQLTQEQLTQFRESGYISPVKLLSSHECGQLRHRIETFERERPTDVSWAFDIKANLLFDWVYELSAQRRTLDAVEDLLGPDIYNTDTVFRIKEPGSRTH